jgi:hypothetical protein
MVALESDGEVVGTVGAPAVTVVTVIGGTEEVVVDSTVDVVVDVGDEDGNVT